MIIRQVNRNTFDVFMADEFWGDWTRVRILNNGDIQHVGGKYVSRKVLGDIGNQIKGV